MYALAGTEVAFPQQVVTFTVPGALGCARWNQHRVAFPVVLARLLWSHIHPVN